MNKFIRTHTLPPTECTDSKLYFTVPKLVYNILDPATAISDYITGL